MGLHRVPRATVVAALVLATALPALAQDPATAYEAATAVRTAYFAYDYEGADALGARLLARFPRHAPLRAWAILARSMNSEEDEAVAMAKAFMAEAPDEPWAYWAWATATTWHGDLDEEALVASADAFRRDPDDPDFLWMRAWALQVHDAQAGLPFLDEHVQRGEETAALLSIRASLISSLSWKTRPRDMALADSALAVLAELRRRFPNEAAGYATAASELAGSRRMAEALPLARRAIELAPKGLSAHWTFWRAVSGQPDVDAEEKRRLIVGDVDALLAMSPDSPGTLNWAKEAFKLLDDKDGVRRIEDRILEIAPESEQAEWVHVERYRAFAADMGEGGWKDAAKRRQYRDLVRAFLDRPVIHQSGLRGDAFRSLFTALSADSMEADPDLLLEAVEGMVEFEGINPHVTFANGPIVLADRGVHLDAAERIARQGVEEGRKKIDQQKKQGAYRTDEEYERAQDWMESMMVDALGWVFFRQGRLEAAETELRRSHDLSPQSRTTLVHLGRLFEARAERAVRSGNDPDDLASTEGDFLDQAETWYARAMETQAPGKNPAEAALRALYIRRRGSADGIEDYFANLSDLDRAKRREKILAERIVEPEPMAAFDLPLLSGGRMASRDAEGKILVINMWGTWCGPCTIEMPDIQEVARKYADDPSVEVFTIDNDTSPELVRRFMDDKGYDFRVLLDDGYLQRSGVVAYPTTWFVGSDGRIAFLKRGWSDDLVEEFSWRIDALR